MQAALPDWDRFPSQSGNTGCCSETCCVEAFSTDVHRRPQSLTLLISSGLHAGSVARLGQVSPPNLATLAAAVRLVVCLEAFSPRPLTFRRGVRDEVNTSFTFVLIRLGRATDARLTLSSSSLRPLPKTCRFGLNYNMNGLLKKEKKMQFKYSHRPILSIGRNNRHIYTSIRYSLIN